MARLLTAVPAATPSLPMVEVPDDVRAELVDLYRHLTEHPNLRGEANFDTSEDKAEWLRQAKSWAVTNDVEFRKVRGSETETGLKFYLRNPQTAEEKAQAEAAREATRKAREAEGKGTPGRKPSGKAK